MMSKKPTLPLLQSDCVISKTINNKIVEKNKLHCLIFHIPRLKAFLAASLFTVIQQICGCKFVSALHTKDIYNEG